VIALQSEITGSAANATLKGLFNFTGNKGFETKACGYLSTEDIRRM
jgi:hypothetical protein